MKENKKTDEKSESEQDSSNKISRRDFLKYGVGAAAVAAGATALMGRIPIPAEQPKTPAANDSAEAIVASVSGDQLTVMNGQVSVKVKDAGLAAQIADKLLQPGEYLHLCIGAANRDPDVFPEPDRFEIGRVPNQHLAFAAGSHACAGMAVARLEAQLAIQGIVRRFPRLRVKGEGVRGARARFRGFRSLPLATH